MPLAEAQRLIAEWPEAPRKTAEKLLDHYGPPNEATATKLFWYRNRPWRRTVLTAHEIVHNFPTAHPTTSPSTSATACRPRRCPSRMVEGTGTLWRIRRTASDRGETPPRPIVLPLNALRLLLPAAIVALAVAGVIALIVRRVL